MQSTPDRFDTLGQQLDRDFSDTVPDTKPPANPRTGWEKLLRGRMPIIFFGIAILVAIFPRTVWALIAILLAILIREMFLLQRERKDALLELDLREELAEMTEAKRLLEDENFQLKKTLEDVEVRTNSEHERLEAEVKQMRRKIAKLESEEHVNERLRNMLQTTSQVANINNLAIKASAEVATAFSKALAGVRKVARELRDDQNDTRVRLAGAAPAIPAPTLHLMEPLPPTPTSPFSIPSLRMNVAPDPDLVDTKNLPSKSQPKTHDTQVDVVEVNS